VIFDRHQGETVELWRAHAGGGNPAKRADKVSGSDCSPDGKWVVFGSMGHLYRMPVEGGKAADIGVERAGLGLFSPDGKSIAYPYTEHGPVTANSVAMEPAEGGAARRVLTIPGDVQGIRWAPDGKRFDYLLTRNGATNVWEQRLAGGELRQLTNFTSGTISDFAWTRDGKTMLLANERRVTCRWRGLGRSCCCGGAATRKGRGAWSLARIFLCDAFRGARFAFYRIRRSQRP
jgi:dipeptidyl aminopeptidase/acylaminoacyl peptidase